MYAYPLSNFALGDSDMAITYIEKAMNIDRSHVGATLVKGFLYAGYGTEGKGIKFTSVEHHKIATCLFHDIKQRKHLILLTDNPDESIKFFRRAHKLDKREIASYEVPADVSFDQVCLPQNINSRMM